MKGKKKKADAHRNASFQGVGGSVGDPLGGGGGSKGVGGGSKNVKPPNVRNYANMNVTGKAKTTN